MPNFKVTQYGSDSSGRPIFMSAYMHDWWERVVEVLGFRPVVTQGAHMRLVAGGGADASAGYHDFAGCLDLRVWDLTEIQVRETVRTLRANGAAAWLRNIAHGGFDDPHIHFVLGTDRPLSSGAALQWREYINGGDGMGGVDYHPRPHPLVTTPPEDDMPLNADDKAWIKDAVTAAVAAEFAKEQKNGRTLRGTVAAIANKLGVKPVED